MNPFGSNAETPETKQFLEGWAKQTSVNPAFSVEHLLGLNDMPIAYRNGDKELTAYFRESHNAMDLFNILLDPNGKQDPEKRTQYINTIMNLFQATSTELHRILADQISIAEYIFSLIQLNKQQFEIPNNTLYGINLIARIVQRAYDSYPSELHEIISLSNRGYPAIVSRIDLPAIFQSCCELNNDTNKGIPLFMWHLLASLARHFSNDPDIIKNVILTSTDPEIRPGDANQFTLRPRAVFLEDDLDLKDDLFIETLLETQSATKLSPSQKLELQLRAQAKVRNAIELLRLHFEAKFAAEPFKKCAKTFLEVIFPEAKQPKAEQQRVFVENPRLFALAATLPASRIIYDRACDIILQETAEKKQLQVVELAMLYIAAFFSAEGIQPPPSSAPSSTPLGAQAGGKNVDDAQKKRVENAEKEKQLSEDMARRLSDGENEILSRLGEVLDKLLVDEKEMHTFILQNIVTLCAGAVQSRYEGLNQVIAKSIAKGWENWHQQYQAKMTGQNGGQERKKLLKARLIVPMLLEAARILDYQTTKEEEGLEKWNAFMDRAVWQWDTDQGPKGDDEQWTSAVYSEFDMKTESTLSPDQKKEVEDDHKQNFGQSETS